MVEEVEIAPQRAKKTAPQAESNAGNKKLPYQPVPASQRRKNRAAIGRTTTLNVSEEMKIPGYDYVIVKESKVNDYNQLGYELVPDMEPFVMNNHSDGEKGYLMDIPSEARQEIFDAQEEKHRSLEDEMKRTVTKQSPDGISNSYRPGGKGITIERR